jgi:hypothetical protein
MRNQCKGWWTISWRNERETVGNGLQIKSLSHRRRCKARVGERIIEPEGLQNNPRYIFKTGMVRFRIEEGVDGTTPIVGRHKGS